MINSLSQSSRKFLVSLAKCPPIVLLMMIIIIAGLMAWGVATTVIPTWPRLWQCGAFTLLSIFTLMISRRFDQVTNSILIGSMNGITSRQHEDISDATILTGLNDIYIDLSSIKTKTIVEFRLDPDVIKTGLKERLLSSGIRLKEDKKSARCTLTFQVVPAMLSEKETTLKAAAVLASVKEILSNDRIRTNNLVNVQAPVWQRQNLAIFKQSLSPAVFQKVFLGSVDAFIEEWQQANKQEATKQE